VRNPACDQYAGTQPGSACDTYAITRVLRFFAVLLFAQRYGQRAIVVAGLPPKEHLHHRGGAMLLGA